MLQRSSARWCRVCATEGASQGRREIAGIYHHHQRRNSSNRRNGDGNANTVSLTEQLRRTRLGKEVAEVGQENGQTQQQQQGQPQETSPNVPSFAPRVSTRARSFKRKASAGRLPKTGQIKQAVNRQIPPSLPSTSTSTSTDGSLGTDCACRYANSSNLNIILTKLGPVYFTIQQPFDPVQSLASLSRTRPPHPLTHSLPPPYNPSLKTKPSRSWNRSCSHYSTGVAPPPPRPRPQLQRVASIRNFASSYARPSFRCAQSRRTVKRRIWRIDSCAK